MDYVSDVFYMTKHSLSNGTKTAEVPLPSRAGMEKLEAKQTCCRKFKTKYLAYFARTALGYFIVREFNVLTAAFLYCSIAGLKAYFRPGLKSTLLPEMEIQEEEVPPASKSHFKSGLERNTFEVFAVKCADEMERRPVFVGPRRRYVEEGKTILSTNERPTMWDMSVDSIKLKDNDLIVLTDMDFHLNMDHLLDTKLPILIYTPSPLSLGEWGNEGGFYFDGDNNLVQTIRGGGVKRHKVLDYGDDLLTSRNYSYIYGYSHYKVYKFQSGHRSLVYLRPLGYSSYNKDPKYIESVQVKVPGTGYNAMMRGDLVHMSLPGSYESFTLSVSDYRAITAKYDVYKNITGAQHLAEIDTKLSARERGIIMTMIKSKGELEPLNYVSLVGSDMDKRIKRVRISQPLADSLAVTQTVDRNMVLESYLARLVIPNNNSRDFIIGNNGYITCADGTKVLILSLVNAFADIMVGDDQVTLPEFQEIWDKLPSKAAQAKFKTALTVQGININNYFSKDEINAKAFPPNRFIGNSIGERRFNMCRFCMAIFPIIKRSHWYGFGRSPTEVAELIAKVATFAEKNNFSVMETDYTKFDASVTLLTRMLLVVIMSKVLSADDMRDFSNLFAESSYDTVNLIKDEDLTVNVIALGLLVSGKYYTSILGSLTNRFKMFCDNVAAGMDFQEAYDFPGVASGDDGLQVATEGMTSTHEALGLDAKIIYRKPGDSLTFLARVYPHPWFGDLNSFADMKRTVNKLTTFAESTIRMKGKYYAFVRKMLALETNDMNTPIIGDLVKFVRIRTPCLCEMVEKQLPSSFENESEAYNYVKTNKLPQRFAEAIFYGRGYPNDINVEDVPTEGLVDFNEFKMSLESIDNNLTEEEQLDCLFNIKAFDITPMSTCINKLPSTATFTDEGSSDQQIKESDKKLDVITLVKDEDLMNEKKVLNIVSSSLISKQTGFMKNCALLFHIKRLLSKYKNIGMIAYHGGNSAQPLIQHLILHSICPKVVMIDQRLSIHPDVDELKKNCIVRSVNLSTKEVLDFAAGRVRKDQLVIYIDDTFVDTRDQRKWENERDKAIRDFTMNRPLFCSLKLVGDWKTCPSRGEVVHIVGNYDLKDAHEERWMGMIPKRTFSITSREGREVKEIDDSAMRDTILGHTREHLNSWFILNALKRSKNNTTVVKRKEKEKLSDTVITELKSRRKPKKPKGGRDDKTSSSS